MGKKIAIFHKDGWYALDALCIHQDQSITCGKIEDGVLECPHHFWHYNLKTGELLDYLKDAKIPESIGGITNFPNRSNMKPYYENMVKDTQEQVDFGIDILRNNDIDFFFQTVFRQIFNQNSITVITYTSFSIITL